MSVAPRAGAATAACVMHEAPDGATLAVGLARYAAQCIVQAVETRGRALLAVSGGSSPLQFFAALRRLRLPWQRVQVIPVDVRCVAPDHADSNATLVRAHLLQDAAAAAQWRPFFDKLPAGWPEDRAPGDAELIALARAANRQLADLPWPIDLAVLGMGQDGHTASLFAGATGLEAALIDTAPVAWTRPPIAPYARLTLTLPTLLAARSLVLPLAGAAKQPVFERACSAPDAALPISLVLHRSPRPVQVWRSPGG